MMRRIFNLDSALPQYIKGVLCKRGKTFDLPEIDDACGCVAVIDSDHHEIHEGDSFTVNFANTTAATNGHRSGIYIRTPLSNEMHMLISSSASNPATISICESPTIAANVGTHGVSIFNRYRDSAKSSLTLDDATTPAIGKATTLTEVQIAADATWNVGTLIRVDAIKVGSGPQAVGGSSRGSQEYILKRGTKYVFLVTNTDASANSHIISLDWYRV